MSKNSMRQTIICFKSANYARMKEQRKKKKTISLGDAGVNAAEAGRALAIIFRKIEEGEDVNV